MSAKLVIIYSLISILFLFPSILFGKDKSQVNLASDTNFQNLATNSLNIKVVDKNNCVNTIKQIKNKYEKISSLEPALLINGRPGSNNSKKAKITLKGRIIPERHPIGRRRFVYRWVLEQKDGKRIPLKSNLKLLQKVKNEELLDSFVSVKGMWLVSPRNKYLSFFKVDNIRIIDEPTEKSLDDASNTNDIKKKTVKVASDSKDVLSREDNIEDLTKTPASNPKILKDY